MRNGKISWSGNSPIVFLETASHLVTEMHWENETLMGTIELLEGDDNITKKARSLVKSRVMLGISSRGVGSVKKDRDGNDVVQEDFELISFDLVSSPSTPGAYLAEGYNNGMRLLTPDDIKVIKDYKNSTDKNFNENTNKFNKIINLSKEDFWKI